jgi:hypothetical protein
MAGDGGANRPVTTLARWIRSVTLPDSRTAAACGNDLQSLDLAITTAVDARKGAAQRSE